MTDRPILFSGPLVRAILDGTKTETRRPMSPQPWASSNSLVWGRGHNSVGWADRPDVAFPLWIGPYGQPGDRLWVRETWAPWACGPFRLPVRLTGSIAGMAAGRVSYRASDGDAFDEALPQGPWRPSIHMPRWASRITLEVTGVRIERVQDISEEDAKAEGVRRPTGHGSYRGEFQQAWDGIYAGRKAKPGLAWADSPWVWVVKFRRVKP